MIEKYPKNLYVKLNAENLEFSIPKRLLIISIFILCFTLVTAPVCSGIVKAICNHINHVHKQRDVEVKRLIKFCIDANPSNKKYVGELLSDGNISELELSALRTFEKAENARKNYGLIE